MTRLAFGQNYDYWLKKTSFHLTHALRHDRENLLWSVQEDEGIPYNVLIEHLKEWDMIPHFILYSPVPDAIQQYMVDVLHFAGNKSRFAVKAIVYQPVVVEMKTYQVLYSLPEEHRGADRRQGPDVIGRARGDPRPHKGKGSGRAKRDLGEFEVQSNLIGYEVAGEQKQCIRLLAFRANQGHSRITKPEMLGWEKLKIEQTEWIFHFSNFANMPSIRDRGLLPGRDCQLLEGCKEGRPEIYFSGQYRGYGGSVQTLPPYSTWGEIVVCVNARQMMEDGHELWVTKSNAIISRAPVSRDYIGQIMETKSKDVCGASLYINTHMILDPSKKPKDDDDLAGAGQDLAGAGRGEKRSDKDRKDPPIRLISVSREEPVSPVGADKKTIAFRLDNSRFPSYMHDAFLDVPVRRSMDINDTDHNWL
ncbi:MAG: hypothetical protein FJ308_23695, partial [Planctomycetes bacterium]|nr:hypothetical protein [Planctomycetota bacterium]